MLDNSIQFTIKILFESIVVCWNQETVVFLVYFVFVDCLIWLSYWTETTIIIVKNFCLSILHML